MKSILLLHGALGAKEQFNELAGRLSTRFDVHTINFSGHGGKDIPEKPFSISMFACDIESYLNDNNIYETDIFGYSMGGYAALYLAQNNPARIHKIFTLATKFMWTPLIAEKEVKMLDAEKIKHKVPKFARELALRHGKDNWETVLAKTSEMMRDLGISGERYGGYELNLEKINNEVMIGLGDKDRMVSLEETIAAYRALPNGKLIVFPGTPHPLEMIDMDRLAGEIERFFV